MLFNCPLINASHAIPFQRFTNFDVSFLLIVNGPERLSA
jgi:hypothetical protein